MQILIGLLGGLGLAIFVVYCYFLLQAIKGMRDAAVGLHTALKPVLDDKSMLETLKSLQILGASAPALLASMNRIHSALQAFIRAVVAVDKTPVASANTEEAGFYPYSDEKAAKDELKKEAKEVGIAIDEKEDNEIDTSKTWVGASV